VADTLEEAKAAFRAAGLTSGRKAHMRPLALSDAQYVQVMTTSYTIPRQLRPISLRRLADLLRGRLAARGAMQAG
jgi:hypothetical protein